MSAPIVVPIAGVGGYQPGHEAHPATTAAIGHAAAALGVSPRVKVQDRAGG